nr:venom peptide [Acharia stimulea]
MRSGVLIVLFLPYLCWAEIFINVTIFSSNSVEFSSRGEETHMMKDCELDNYDISTQLIVDYMKKVVHMTPDRVYVRGPVADRDWDAYRRGIAVPVSQTVKVSDSYISGLTIETVRLTSKTYVNNDENMMEIREYLEHNATQSMNSTWNGVGVIAQSKNTRYQVYMPKETSNFFAHFGTDINKIVPVKIRSHVSYDLNPGESKTVHLDVDLATLTMTVPYEIIPWGDVVGHFSSIIPNEYSYYTEKGVTAMLKGMHLPTRYEPNQVIIFKFYQNNRIAYE